MERNLNRLSGQICYLAGFIDDNPIEARGWRKDMQLFLNNLGIGVFDPCDKAILNVKVSEDEEFVKNTNVLKQEGQYDLASKRMQEIVRLDLKMVDLSSFLILNIDRNYHMCGSYSEFTYACMQRKPVFIYCKQGIDKISNWIWGLGDHEYFYDDWDKLKQHIERIALGNNPDDLNSKWRWFDYDKIFGRQK